MWRSTARRARCRRNLPLGALKGDPPDWSPDETRSSSRPATGTRPAGAGLAVTPVPNGTVGRAQDARGPPHERRTEATRDQPLPDALARRQVDRLLARRKGGHGDLTAQLWIDAGRGRHARRARERQPRRLEPAEGRPAPRTPSRPGRRPATSTGSRSTRSARTASSYPKGHAADLGRGGRSGQARAGRRDPSYPAFRLQFQGLRGGQPPRLLDARRARPRPAAAAAATARRRRVRGRRRDLHAGVDRCCDSGARCDTRDDGATYVCLPPVVIK